MIWINLVCIGLFVVGLGLFAFWLGRVYERLRQAERDVERLRGVDW
jgi:hypothetical protein